MTWTPEIEPPALVSGAPLAVAGHIGFENIPGAWFRSCD